MQKKTGLTRREWVAVAMALILILGAYLVSTAENTYARHQTTHTGSGMIQIADPQLRFVEGPPSLTDLLPGGTREYAFTLVNEKDQAVTEVDLRYSFEIQYENTDGGKPLHLVYALEREMEDGTRQPVAMRDARRTDWVTIGSQTEEAHRFVLKITWDAAQTSAADYADRAQRFSIRTFVEQIPPA